MARYTIDFSTNASYILQEIEKINAAIAKTARTGKSVQINLDTSRLSSEIDNTFRKLDRQIAAMQTKLSNLKIGSRKFQERATGIGIAEGLRERGTMQAQSIRLGAQAEAFDVGSATRLQKQLQAARIEASQIAPNTEPWINLQRQIGILKTELQAADRLAENIQMQESLGAFAPGSLNALEAKLVVLRNRAREISPNTTEWKQLNQEIVKTEQAVERQNRKPLTRGQRFGAAGGAFLYGGGLGGGAGSAIGGITGGLFGGVPGAFTGAAIGQAVDNLTAMTAAMTEQAVVIEKLRLGLSSVSTNFSDFVKANQEVVGIANKLLLPLDQVYRKFTQLRASTRALGIDTETTGRIFEGTASAVLKTGGSMDDVDGAMRAVVQVFSKGKLTAEELRGQLAERLPGAVVEFAQSAGMSLQELDKAFEGGTTSIDDFVKFLRGKAKESKSFTDEMANGSEYAGARMAKAFEKLRIDIGQAFQPAGAAIQDFATRSIQFLNGVIDKAIELKLIQPGSGFYAEQVLQGGMTREQLQGDIATEQARIAASKERGLAALAGGANTLAGKILTDLGGAYSDAQLKKLKGALATLEKYDKNFRAAVKQATQATLDEQRPQKMLDAIDNKQEAIDKARKQREQEIVEIRQNALSQIANLERKYQDERLNAERELGRVQRDLAAASQEQALLRREAASALTGEDPALIEQERKLGEAIRQYTEEKIQIEQNEQDRKIAKDRELEDFKKGNADAINKANERYAKQIGEIQRTYAKTVAKLIEEGSGNGAKRLAAAGKYVAAAIARASAQESFTAQTGGGLIIPSGKGKYTVGEETFSEQELIKAAQASKPGTKNAALAFIRATKDMEEAQKVLGASLSTSAQSAAPNLPTIDVSDLTAKFVNVQKSADGVNAKLNEAGSSLNKQKNLVLALEQAFADISKPQKDSLDNLTKQEENLHNQINLLKTGISSELIEQNKQLNEQLKANNDIYEKSKQRAQAAAQQLLDAADPKDLGLQQKINEALENQLGIIEKIKKQADAKVKAIFDLQQIEKNIQEVRRLVESFVGDTVSDYKGFLKAVISGEDAVDALEKFQQGLKDRVLTIFLDFAMKPMEDMLKNTFNKIFTDALVPKTALEEGTDKNTFATDKNTTSTDNLKTSTDNLKTAIENLTSALTTTAGTGSDGNQPQSFNIGGSLANQFKDVTYGDGKVSNVFADSGINLGDYSETFKTAADSMGMSFKDISETSFGFSESLNQNADGIAKATKGAAESGTSFVQGLGSVVQGIGAVAGAAMSIGAGIKQIEKGDTGSVISGIGSILAGVGGAILGLGPLFGGKKAANGAVWKGGFTAFADGGTVSGPTLGLIGEGKYNEAIVPLPDGKAIPVQLNSNSIREKMNGSSNSGVSTPVLAMSFQTTTINNVEYVSKDQLEKAMMETRRVATKEGARQGANLAIDKIQQSPNVRKRIGV